VLKWTRAALAVALTVVPAIGAAQSNPSDDKPHPPHPAALAACKDKSDGDTCEFDAPHGHVSGTCHKVASGDLACVHPHRHPDGGAP
jgi:hypothetical protein